MPAALPETADPRAGALALGAWGLAAEAVTWSALVPATLLSRLLAPGPVPLRQELRERLGRAVPARSRGAGPWLVHAVSAGEMVAASALVAEMARRRNGLRVLLTTGTAAGRAVAEGIRERFPDVVAGVGFLPWDRPRVVRAWLARADAAGVVLVEAELWPGLLAAARDAGLPLLLCSGRMTEGESRRYALVRPFFGPLLSAASWVGAQTPADARRFVRAGAPEGRTVASGNLKWDAPAGGRELPGPWREALGGEIVVAASTHAPEEEVLLEALRLARESVPAARLVVAPRQVGRAAAIVEAARRRGLDAALLSEAPPASWDVLVVDSWGHLPALFGRARAAFVGGSLAPRGGHSPAEAALAGLPLLMGPSDGETRGEAARLEERGALFRVDPRDAARSAASILVRLLGDPGAGREAREAVESAVAGARGAAAAAVDALLAAPARPLRPACL